MRGVDFGVEVVRPFASEAEVAYDFWALHNFVADRVIECKEGYIAGTNPMERGLQPAQRSHLCRDLDHDRRTGRRGVMSVGYSLG